jgi:beta-lysine 5,6-aminomutase beta subunit
MSFLKLLSKKEAKGRSHGTVTDLSHIKPYGDLLGDGAIQLSFTLPVPASPEAKEAAKQYVEKLGLKNIEVACMESMGKDLSFFVVYGHSTKTLNFNKIKVPKVPFEKMDFEEINRFAQKKFKRKIVVVGATTGADAHTMGLDAIMNMKGYMGDYGLERYPCFRAYNLRSQVSHEELLKQAAKYKADVLLVSKVVTQRGHHLNELKELAKEIKRDSQLKDSIIKIAGGPRLSHAQAAKVGFDAGFGPGTLPSEVASFIVQEYARRA